MNNSHMEIHIIRSLKDGYMSLKFKMCVVKLLMNESLNDS